MATAEVHKVREYETIYVLSPNTTKEGSEKIATRVGEVMEREQGVLTLVENWGRRQLAYPVSKHRRGVYVYLKYTGGGAVVNELERNFRMLDEVLKFQTVKVRDEVDPATVQVDVDAVKFEGVEPPMEGEESEETLEQQLGLADSPAAHSRASRDDDNDDEAESEPRRSPEAAEAAGEEEEDE